MQLLLQCRDMKEMYNKTNHRPSCCTDQLELERHSYTTVLPAFSEIRARLFSVLHHLELLHSYYLAVEQLTHVSKFPYPTISTQSAILAVTHFGSVNSQDCSYYLGRGSNATQGLL